MLTDAQRKAIIADRVDGLSYRKIAARHGVSDYAVRSVLKREPELSRKIAEKKEQNTLDMFDFMDAKKMDVQEFIELGLAAMKDKRKLEKAGVQSIATAIGIVLDKYIQISKARETEQTESELLRSLLDLERGKRG